MKEKLTIVKVGGAVVEDEQQLSQLLKDFSAIQGRKVLVHGGGRKATKMAERLGIETKMVEGRRITDAQMLEQSHKRPPRMVNGEAVDYGYVGDVDHVSNVNLSQLIEAGITPVMAPFTHDGQGNILNTNADTMASETAKALAHDYDVTLIFSFEKKGVLSNPDDDDSVIPVITKEDFERYKADGTISGGMLPKIENALKAVDAGVSRVIITLATALDGCHGTVIK